MSADDRNIPDMLAAPDGATLTTEQARRATCLALALELLRGRGVHVSTVREVAEWLYAGDPS